MKHDYGRNNFAKEIIIIEEAVSETNSLELVLKIYHLTSLSALTVVAPDIPSRSVVELPPCKLGYKHKNCKCNGISVVGYSNRHPKAWRCDPECKPMSFLYLSTFVNLTMAFVDNERGDETHTSRVDLDLVLTYHCCDCSPEVSKQVLDLHFTLRTLFATYFKDRDLSPSVMRCLNTILYAPLPTPSLQGHRIFYCHLLDTDPKCFIFNESVKVFMMVFDLWQREDGTWPGFEIIIDLDQAVIGHVTKLDVTTVRQTLYFLQEAMLVRLKGVHFLNAPYFMDRLMMLLKPFIKKELLDIVHIHQIKSDTIEKFIPKEALPKESGGQYMDYNTIKENLIERLRANREFFKDESRKRVDESRRPAASRVSEDLSEMRGSFKRLDID
ncbi:Alpha-tocopherol transfer protein-like [Eumeta japonica]|uniref:Alpha-tocopherol transfer protein-like n=1 Tax=Eumeta variegata TaxID=151549 RepID=A0A4C1ZCL3_EUMVA|nr:Alpha-tocopherol transfer protein-like [Eumeta japonica]